MKVRHWNRDTSKASLCIRAFTRVHLRARVRVQRSVVRMTAEECTSDAIVIARSRVFRKDAYSVFLYVTSTLPSSGRPPFLVLSLRYIAKIYGLFAASARERDGRAAGWFDKSLLVKRLPDCRERDERRGGGCDLRPMVEFLSDADCSRLLWMVIAGSPSPERERLQDAVDREKKSRPIL